MKGGTEQDDEEFEMLLGEIPSATAAPPHLEEVQRTDESPKGEGVLLQQNARKSSTPETYDNFYQDYQGVKNLSASPGGTIVSVSPMSSNCFPAFYGGLSFNGSASGSSLQLQPEQQHTKVQAMVHTETITEQGQLQSNVSIHHNGIALPTKQIFVDNQALTTAFGNLNFKEDKVLSQGIQASGQPGDGRYGSPVLVNGQAPIIAAKVYSHFDVAATSVPGQLNGVGSLNSMGSPSNTSLSNVHGIRYPSQHKNLSGFFQAAGNDMSNPAMRKLLKYNGYGTNTHGNNLGLPLDGLNVESYDPQRLIPLYSTAAAPAPEMPGFHILPSASISRAEVLSPISGLQQQYYMDTHIGSFLQPQPQQCGPPVPALQSQINRMHLMWQHIEEERYRRMHQQYMLQHVQTQARGSMPNQAAAGIMGGSLDQSFRQQVVQPSMTISQPEQPLYKHQQQGLPAVEGDWSASLIPGTAGASAINFSDFSLQSGNLCRYHAQGFCGRGESCPFSHSQAQMVASGRISAPGNILTKDPSGVTILNGEEKPVFPEKILTRNRSRGVNTVRTINLSPAGGRKDSLSNGNGSGRVLSDGHHSSALRVGSFQLDNQGHHRELSPENVDFELIPRTLSSSQQQQLLLPKYTSLDEVEGRIYCIARDQHGCRFLQKKFDEGRPEDVQKIFVEIIDHIIELMTDPFGNYLVQKLLEVCNEDQRMQILHAITGKPGELVNISLNMHGTRAVQKLIETLETPQQVSMVTSSLILGVVTLIKDLNGNHVVQRCLQCLGNEDSQFLFDAAAAHCVEIATHRHGCCVLQRCVDFSTGAQRQRLVAEIAANALFLSQDPFGNYVVQYILDLGIPWANDDVMNQLEGNYACLSMQKFSSNVVEKCLKLAGEEKRARIIRELINNSRLGQLLQDPFANYVVQSALTTSKGPLHAAFVEAIRPHLPALRSSPFGKRILSRTNLKK